MRGSSSAFRCLALAGLIVAWLTACTGTPDGLDSQPTAPPDVATFYYTCANFPITNDLLLAPARHDEDADTPIAAALREHLARPAPDIAFFPKTGWTLAWQGEHASEFIQVGGDLSLKMVHVDDASGPWQVGGYGDCLPQLVLAEGLGPAQWEWGSADEPTPETTGFDALVTELACASGQSAEGRVAGPQVVRARDIVLVVFAIRPLPGGQDCQGNPSTRATVDIGEPLGDRELVDGGKLRPGNPSSPAPGPAG